MTAPRPPLNPRPRADDRPPTAPMQPVRVPRPGFEGRPRRAKPDATGVRLVLGLAGLASASALATAMLPSILPQAAVAATGADAAAADQAQQPDPSVIHVTRVVQLAPGQTLPPDVAAAAAASAGPATPTPQPTARPTPRVIYQTITRQSGKP